MKTYGTVVWREGQWLISAEPQVVVRIKRLFDKIHKGLHGAVHLVDTPEISRELAWFFIRYPMIMSDQDAARLHEQERLYLAYQEDVVRILSGEYIARTFNLALPLRPYQQVAADLTLKTGQLLVADEIGLGKTLECIAVITEEVARPTLVVTLTHLPGQWKAECAKFAPDLNVHVLKQGKPYDLTNGGKDPFPDVIISNYHKLNGWAEELSPYVKGLFFDEAQELRRTGSLKYDAAEHLRKTARICAGYSGTPIYNYGDEIFSVLEIIAPGKLGSFEEFTREWCWPIGQGRYKIKDPKAFGSYLRDQGLMLRRTRKDVARELPPIQRVIQYVEAEEKPMADIASSIAELAKILMSQGGYTSFERMEAAGEVSYKLRQATGIAKARHVADVVRLLVESGEKVVLYGWHHAVYDIWMDRLANLKPVLYTGEQSTAQKEASRKAFVEGDSSVFIMSLRSGAGLDGLQHVSHVMVFGELDWSRGVHLQCEGREDRDGQAESVLAVYCVADVGSDPVIVDVLGVKQAQLEGILDPDAALITQMDNAGEDRIKNLAKAFLSQRGLTVEEIQVGV